MQQLQRQVLDEAEEWIAAGYSTLPLLLAAALAVAKLE
jgi:hypothetical protein